MTHVNLALTQAVLVRCLRPFWNIPTAAENHFNKPIIIGAEVTQICNEESCQGGGYTGLLGEGNPVAPGSEPWQAVAIGRTPSWGF